MDESWCETQQLIPTEEEDQSDAQDSQEEELSDRVREQKTEVPSIDSSVHNSAADQDVECPDTKDCSLDNTTNVSVNSDILHLVREKGNLFFEGFLLLAKTLKLF